MPLPQDRWYAEGLAFSCTQCGRCCTNHGDYAYVYLSRADVAAIADYLGLTKREFRREHTVKEGGWTSLKIEGETCPFLDDQKRCTIYPVRPKQCATWPFWVENLERETWEGPVAECCPGIGKGEVTPADEVERIAEETEEWYRKG